MLLCRLEQHAAMMMLQCDIVVHLLSHSIGLRTSTADSEGSYQAVVAVGQVAGGDALPVPLDATADAHPAAVCGVAAVHGGSVHDAAMARLHRYIHVHHHPLGHK